MARYAYVNGRYLPHSKASIHIEDRGFQFADGIYEVVACINGKLSDERGHLDRLERSLGEIQMPMPVSRASLQLIIRELVRRNGVKNGAVYIQVTRGTSKRDFKFPVKNVKQTLVLTTWNWRFDNNPSVEKGVKVISVPDQRWKRRDIKSVGLLPQVLARQAAIDAGANEAWMIDDHGFVTEGASCNAWIIRGNVLQTRPANKDILRGVTRTAIEKAAAELQLQIVEKPFTIEEAYQADEAFNTSATGLAVPVISIDGHKIGHGAPGPIAKRLYEEYLAYADGARGEHLAWKA